MLNNEHDDDDDSKYLIAVSHLIFLSVTHVCQLSVASVFYHITEASVAGFITAACGVFTCVFKIYASLSISVIEMHFKLLHFNSIMITIYCFTLFFFLHKLNKLFAIVGAVFFPFHCLLCSFCKTFKILILNLCKYVFNEINYFLYY